MSNTPSASSSSSSQPLLVTDQDVLTQLDNDDAIVTAVQAAFDTLGAKAPASLSGSWSDDKAAYQAWAKDARDKASGGFFVGAWFGVPDLYRYAVDYGHTLQAYAPQVQALGATLPTLPTLPPQSSPVANPLGGGTTTGIGIGLAVGLGAAALVVLAVRR